MITRLLSGYVAASCIAAGCGGGGGAAPPARDAAADSLLAACLPTCILDLYAGCAPEGACTAQRDPAAGVTDACFRSGAREHREVQDGGAVVTTTYRRDGTACVRKTQTGNELDYVSLIDGRTARVHAVSRDLHTAFCGDDAYPGAYALPMCAALEEYDCTPGKCP